MTTISSPAIRRKVGDAKRREEVLPFQKCLILSCAKNIREELSRVMINRVPQPPLLAFAPHQAPHGIPLGGLNLPQDDGNVLRIKRREPSFMDLCYRRLFFSRIAN